MNKIKSSLALMLILIASNCFAQRTEISLNGSWQITKTDISAGLPSNYSSTVPVPGLIDMAKPVLDEPYKGTFVKNLGNGNSSYMYNNSVYWYRRTFSLQNIPAGIIQLKLNKSMFHTRVFVNGKFAGENFYCFTPSYFDIKPFIKSSGGENELVISVGCRNNMPDTICHGDDFEKVLFAPGIYDDVKIIVSGFPHIKNIQTVPDIQNKQLRVVTEIDNNLNNKPFDLNYTIRERNSGKVVSKGILRQNLSGEKNQSTLDFKISLPDCILWSPENPFLYSLELSTNGDRTSAIFGMRSFKSDKEKGVVLLNDKTYYLRGTNVCIFRFFEDSERGNLPWDQKWVARLHSRFKELKWNSIRYCIGFPPERWYEIADSLGLLIQDEFPIWKGGEVKSNPVTSDQLAAEYREWMRERWNHACVVIWDAENESVSDKFAPAINKVRKLDLSDRPWENGWSRPAGDNDVIEAHPYRFYPYYEALSRNKKPVIEDNNVLSLFYKPMIPDNSWLTHSKAADKNEKKYPIIINEYGWIWLNRDGSPTTLTTVIYDSLFPEANTSGKRLELYAKLIAMKTEYWRAHRLAAGVLHFCDLSYSRSRAPLGQTSDNFIDIKNLIFEPNYYKAMKSAFSPVGIMLDFFKNKLIAGQGQNLSVILINDTYVKWAGSISLTLTKEGKERVKKTVAANIGALGKETFSSDIKIPAEKGKYQLTAEITYNGESVKSIREFIVE